jgi:hypothetical protein
VLQTRCPVHSLSDAFVAEVDEEAETLLASARPSGALSWKVFHDGWFRFFRCVVLGRRARDDKAVTDLLKKLRGSANWAFFRPRRRKLRARFLAELERRLDRAEPGSLASLICDAESSRSSPTHQAAQWLFAFDAAGIAVFRTLALLAVHPKEMAWARNDVLRRAERPELPYLRACMLDCLRLWPTSPAVLRETDAETRWDTGVMAAGTGLLIHVPFLHRDDSRIPYADSFAPEAWLSGEAQHWPFIPFSAGTAECPARNLVLLLASAMLAALLERSDFRMPEGRELVPGKLPATFDQACSRASRTKLACAVRDALRDTRQPTIRRAIGIDHEGDVDEAFPGRHVGEVGDPKRVRPRRLELPPDVIQRARRCLVADRGPDRLAADHALQAHLPHQARHRAAGHIVTLAQQLPPDLAHAVDAKFSSKTRRICGIRAASCLARAGSFEGSSRRAAWAW